MSTTCWGLWIQSSCDRALVVKKLMGYQGDSQGRMPGAIWHLWANCAPEAHSLASGGRAAVSQMLLNPFCRTRSAQLDTVALETALEGKLCYSRDVFRELRL